MARLFGPFQLPDNLTGQSYLEFLLNDLPNLLENVSEELRESYSLKNYGCPAHYAIPVCAYLNRRYPIRWIPRARTSTSG